MIGWAAETLTVRRRAAPNWLPRHTVRSFFSNPKGPQLATVRAGNVIGGGDWGVDRLVPDLVRAAETRTPARIRNPRNVRPWQHVLEPVRGYLMLGARLIDTGKGFAGGWNFGPDRDAAVDVITLADLVVEKWNGSAPLYVVEQRTNEPPESVVLRLDSTKSYVELGWKPLLSIGEAASMTVEWHLRYQPESTCDTSIFAAADCRICRCLGREQREGVHGRTSNKDRSMRVNYGQAVYGEEEIAAVVEVMRSSTQMGARVRAMQERVAALFSKRHGIMVNSGSSANYLAIELLDLPKGSEVITPALTFATTVAPIVRAGLIPVFVDAAEATVQHRCRGDRTRHLQENAGRDDPVADRQSAGLGPHSRDCRQASR